MPKIVFTVAVTIADLNDLAEAGKAAAVDNFNLRIPESDPESWAAHRAKHWGGPVAADLGEMLAGMFADFLPQGGYEFDLSAFALSDSVAPEPSNDGGVLPGPAEGRPVRDFPAVEQADVGRRIRITKIQDPDEQDLIGLTGKLAHPFPGKMYEPRENYIAGIEFDAPSPYGTALNLERGDEYEFI